MFGQPLAAERNHRRRTIDTGNLQPAFGQVLRERRPRTASEIQNPCAFWQSLDEKIVPAFVIPKAPAAISIPRQSMPFVMADDMPRQVAHGQELGSAGRFDNRSQSSE